MIRIKKGLDLPLEGKPINQAIKAGNSVKTVAITATDYNGLKPSMLVKVGDTVNVRKR
jgi:Na+-transporting NADH:ubiquinone oxidoreductase subunit A